MPAKLGTIKNARLALKMKSGHIPLQPNWKRLGYGVSRQVYLGPDGVVYKVSKMGDWANQWEHDNSIKLRKRQAKLEFKIPRTSLYLNGKVLCMEYVEKSPTKRVNMYCKKCFTAHSDWGACGNLRCNERLSRVSNEELDLYDYHYNNVVIDKNGDTWAIDLVH